MLHLCAKLGFLVAPETDDPAMLRVSLALRVTGIPGRVSGNA